ncbi:MAG: MYXO-CTERM sorting domain-containing protein [Planctomycetota bacterium]
MPDKKEGTGDPSRLATAAGQSVPDGHRSTPVPLPSGVLMGLAGLGIVAIRRRRH